MDQFSGRVKAIFIVGIFGLYAAFFFFSGTVHAATNVSASGNAHWGWNDAIGWIDFYSPNNINVISGGITGYASSSVGYVSLDCSTPPTGGSVCGTSNYHTINDGSGSLSGWAWNDAIGWISFDCHNTSSCGTSNYQVTVDTNGIFHGWAWNDAIGWISFNCEATCGTSNYYLSSAWVATGTIGLLDSATYDTGVAGGAQLNSVAWQGVNVPGGLVSFQFAVSAASSGPWGFSGPDGTINTYYTPAGPGVPLKLNYTLYNNYRYFRYRVTLVATPTSTPQVDNVIVNWSP